jgi:hypothetical protein
VIKKLNEMTAQSPVMAKHRGGAVSQSISWSHIFDKLIFDINERR